VYQANPTGFVGLLKNESNKGKLVEFIQQSLAQESNTNVDQNENNLNIQQQLFGNTSEGLDQQQ